MGRKGYTSKRYDGIPVGVEIRRDIGKNRIFRVRRGNGFYGSVLGEVIQDQYAYVAPDPTAANVGQENKDRFADAVAAWQALNEEVKDEWRGLERLRKGTTGYTLFIADYIGRIPAVAKFIEDADADTRVDTELNADEDKVRIKTSGVERAVIDAGGCVTPYGFFHDRGDPAAWDFGVGNFTTDGTWRDLDLSAIVPAGAKAVLFIIEIKDDILDAWIRFRENGNSNERNTARIKNQIANYSIGVDLITPCDTNRVIEYQAANRVWTDISMTIKGWWK